MPSLSKITSSSLRLISSGGMILGNLINFNLANLQKSQLTWAVWNLRRRRCVDDWIILRQIWRLAAGFFFRRFIPWVVLVWNWNKASFTGRHGVGTHHRSNRYCKTAQPFGDFSLFFHIAGTARGIGISGNRSVCRWLFQLDQVSLHVNLELTRWFEWINRFDFDQFEWK